MAGEQNLKIIRSTEEARKRGAAGGKKSGEARRNKKLLRDCLEVLLERKTEIDGIKLTGAEAIALTAVEMAKQGNIKAMEFVRDTAGQKPVERLSVSEVDPSVISEVEAMVYDTGEAAGNDVR